MENSNLIIVLALITLLAGVVYGVWQYNRARQAKRDNEHSAVTEKRTELRADASGGNRSGARPMGERVDPTTADVRDAAGKTKDPLEVR